MISKAELAKKANISPMTITRIEQGLPCRMKTKRKVALVLGYKISDETEIISLFIRDKGGKRLVTFKSVGTDKFQLYQYE